MTTDQEHLHHVIRSQQFDRGALEKLFIHADRMAHLVKTGYQICSLDGKTMFCLFYEPSTRTRISFERAMQLLGGQVIFTENAGEFSSAAKGEMLEDSIRVLCGYYPDVIVLRHFESGSAQKAADISDQVNGTPIINAGDGAGQHPTQALLDLYTIQKELERIDGIKIAMVGDLANGRTVRSLAYLLGKFNDVEIFFVAPDVVRIGDDIKDHLTEHGVLFIEEIDLRIVAPQVDVIYQTRIQRERFRDRPEEYEEARGIYIIDREIMALMKNDAIVMHPLPRVEEIALEVDADSRAAYFRQAQNGLFVRMALLEWILG